jgi:hypothetical protein
VSGASLADLDGLFDSGAPADLLVSAKPAEPPDNLRFVAFNPRGMQVRATHDPGGMPVLEQLQDDFSRRQNAGFAPLLARPGKVAGPSVPLLSFRASADALQVHTGYRAQGQGRALHDAIVAARDRQDLTLTPSDMLRPRAGLLPHEHVLCAQRASTLAVSPSVWACSITEVLEPNDIDRRGMVKLLARLESDELPALVGLGSHKFVGLGVRPLSYTWQLVSVLDLRKAPLEMLKPILTAMAPDADSSAWAVLPLHDIAQDERPYPEALYNPDAFSCADLITAQFIANRLSTC